MISSLFRTWSSNELSSYSGTYRGRWVRCLGGGCSTCAPRINPNRCNSYNNKPKSQYLVWIEGNPNRVLGVDELNRAIGFGFCVWRNLNRTQFGYESKETLIGFWVWRNWIENLSWGFGFGYIQSNGFWEIWWEKWRARDLWWSVKWKRKFWKLSEKSWRELREKSAGFVRKRRHSGNRFQFN